MKLQRLGGWAIALVAAVGVNASAADRPSQATLAAMGLGDLAVMSDSDATAIRGMGFQGGHSKKGKSSAHAWGSSWASIHTNGGGAGSHNGYDSKGEHFAVGANFSFAGKLVISSGGHGGGGGGNWGGDAGAAWQGDSGGMNGHNNHKPKVKAVVVFAGGGSFAKAD